MGSPEPIEPDVPYTPPPSGSSERADWLVGPEEGIEAELQRKEREGGGEIVVPKLFRPGADQAPVEPARAPRAAAPTPLQSAPLRAPAPLQAPLRSTQLPDPNAPREPEPPAAWAPVGNSVPSLQRTKSVGTSTFATESPFEIPMDDVDERRAAMGLPALPPPSEAADDLLPAEHEIVDPKAFEGPAPKLPLHLELPHLLRTDRKTQLITAGILLVIITAIVWPKPEPTVPVRQLKKHPDRYDGRTVSVTGRTGEVFHVGGGYAFYLHQGKDTIVVFTRSRVPKVRKNVRVKGDISTGYLDGQARLALFEQAPQ